MARPPHASGHFNVCIGKSTLPGYGRIWRIPVTFTINREGQLIDNGWQDKNSSTTSQRLERIVTPLLGN